MNLISDLFTVWFFSVPYTSSLIVFVLVMVIFNFSLLFITSIKLHMKFSYKCVQTRQLNTWLPQQPESENNLFDYVLGILICCSKVYYTPVLPIFTGDRTKGDDKVRLARRWQFGFVISRYHRCSWCGRRSEAEWQKRVRVQNISWFCRWVDSQLLLNVFVF